MSAMNHVSNVSQAITMLKRILKPTVRGSVNDEHHYSNVMRDKSHFDALLAEKQWQAKLSPEQKELVQFLMRDSERLYETLTKHAMQPQKTTKEMQDVVTRHQQAYDAVGILISKIPTGTELMTDHKDAGSRFCVEMSTKLDIVAADIASQIDTDNRMVE